MYDNAQIREVIDRDGGIPVLDSGEIDVMTGVVPSDPSRPSIVLTDECEHDSLGDDVGEQPR